MSFAIYNSYLTGFTGAQFILPVKPAVLSYTVTVQSGVAYVNGYSLGAGTQLKWGGYNTSILAGDNVVVVGCTGGNVLVNWDTVNYG